MSGTKELLQELLDREAIRDLPLRYCDCVWRNDIDGLVSLLPAKANSFSAAATWKPALRGMPH